ncbi:MAG: hypothetical protein LBU47_02665 [Christensenellaceae bacterium]|nr:hypothetical protein [Christensenellaceae bacterium]
MSNNQNDAYRALRITPASVTAPALIDLSAAKVVNGAGQTAGFSFAVFDAAGEMVSEATSDENGSILFPTFKLQARPASYLYTIRELDESGGGWTMDSRSIPAIVTTVLGDRNNLLVESIDYPEGYPTFTNTYEGPYNPGNCCCRPCCCNPCCRRCR